MEDTTMEDTTMESRHSISRRRFASFVGTGVLAMAAGTVIYPAGARAGVSWCKTDPIVEIDGKRLHIYVWSYQSDTKDIVSGPTEVLIAVPVGSVSTFIWADDGFGRGYSVLFVPKTSLSKDARGTQIQTTVLVPASKSQSVVVELERSADLKLLGYKQGATNREITAGGWL